ncbi:MAG: response regulator [Elusimicrobiota bacterium]|nr:response regulator [Endomicrobiia bacterium]MDW8165575.1 response regulator [Elusimicrobiota bacterium]
MKKILIVEDEELLLDAFISALKRRNYEVIGISNGKEAVDYIKDNKVDLIILDIKLPDMSGLQVLESIRKILPSVPIIMCTAYDSFKTDYQVWANQVSDYVVKPVVLEEIEAKIKKIFNE